MLSLLIGLVIALLIIGVAYWVVMALLGLVPCPPIVGVAVQIIFVLIVVIVLINFLMALGGHSTLDLGFRR
jgi:hypothetical protein